MLPRAMAVLLCRMDTRAGRRRSPLSMFHTKAGPQDLHREPADYIRGLPCAPVVRPAVHPAPGAAAQVCTPPLATDPWLSAGNSTSRAPNRTLECGWSRFLNICHSSGLKPLEEVKLGNYGLPRIKEGLRCHLL